MNLISLSQIKDSVKSFETEVKKFAKKYSLKVVYSSESFAEVSGREPDIEDAYDGWDTGRDFKGLDVMVSDKSSIRLELELMK